MNPETFTLHIGQEKLDDLRQRLARTRLPDPSAGSGWDLGSDRTFMDRLLSHWSSTFDWREQEALLNGFPQYVVTLDGIKLHYLHVPAKNGTGRPLLLSHGWPGSIFEFMELIPRLTDPEKYGGSPEDAFSVVAPSLPGYGLSYAPGQRFVPVGEISEIFIQLMRDVLGYQQFAAQGGDIGAWVTTLLGAHHPDKVVGVHLNMLWHGIDPDHQPSPSNDAERAFLDHLKKWRRYDGAYGHMHGTRPLTLAYGLTDSPAGLAAWIVEKFRAWSDCGGNVESVFTLDQLLADITLYWMTGAIFTSFAPYHDEIHNISVIDRTVTVPTAYIEFPHEIVKPPRSFAEKRYANIQRWTTSDRGGHFAAMEQPNLMAQDIREFFRDRL